jgi:hypothetical protein
MELLRFGVIEEAKRSSVKKLELRRRIAARVKSAQGKTASRSTTRKKKVKK